MILKLSDSSQSFLQAALVLLNREFQRDLAAQTQDLLQSSYSQEEQDCARPSTKARNITGKKEFLLNISHVIQAGISELFCLNVRLKHDIRVLGDKRETNMHKWRFIGSKMNSGWQRGALRERSSCKNKSKREKNVHPEIILSLQPILM